MRDGFEEQVREKERSRLVYPFDHGPKPGEAIGMPLTVSAVERVGPESFVYGTLDRGDNIIVRLPGTHAPAPGERAIAVANRAKLHVFSADGQRRLSSRS